MVVLKHRLSWILFLLLCVCIYLLWILEPKISIPQNLKISCPIFDDEPFDDLGTLVNLTNFDYIINKPQIEIKFDKNGVQIPSFVIIIHSNPYKQEYRNSMRRTWSHSDPRALVYFALGAVNTTKKQIDIENEDRTYNDIIQGNFYDSYRNLTYKHTMVLKWFKYNANGIKYLVKIDDDVYANIPGISKYLIELPEHNEKFLAAPVVNPHPMVRDGKYAISMDESMDNYTVTYGIGNQVIYSYDTVVAIHDQTTTQRFFPMDDMFILGYIRINLNIGFTVFSHVIYENVQKLISDNYEPPADWCFTSATIHNFEGELIRKKMKKYTYNAEQLT